jgi:hypothetical protein
LPLSLPFNIAFNTFQYLSIPTASFGVCSTIDTSTNGLKQVYTKPRGNFLENLFSKKRAFKNNLQLLAKKFLSRTNTTPKNGNLLNKVAHFQESSIFQ